MIARVLCLGLVNWLLTVIVVRSFVFAPLRAAVARLDGTAGYLVHCELCMGTWLGWWLAAVAGGPFGWIFLDGLLIKAVGHLVLIAADLGGVAMARLSPPAPAAHTHPAPDRPRGPSDWP